jgi:hypothetical protein
MQRLEVSGAVRPLYVSLGVKGLTCFTSPFWRLEFWGGFYIVRKHLYRCSLDICFQCMLFCDAAWVEGDLVGTKRWWKDSDREKLKYWERNLSHCHFIYQKSQLNRSRTEPVSSRWEAGTKLLHDLFSGRYGTWWMNRRLTGWFGRSYGWSSPLYLYKHAKCNCLCVFFVNSSTWRWL